MAKEKTQQYDTAALLFGGATQPQEEPQKKRTPKKAKPAAQKTAPKQKTEEKKPQPAADPAAATTQTAYRQKRDKRLQVVLTQELYDRLQEEKELTGAKSVNEIVNVLLTEGLNKRR